MRYLKVEFVYLLVISFVLSACSLSQTAPPSQNQNPPKTVPGNQNLIIADGSSTVGPITTKVVEKFKTINDSVEIQVDISGTGGGFKKFCAGETDISDASRPIKGSEIEICRQNGIDYIELPIAFDGVAVMTNLENDFVSCLKTEELQDIWKPDSWRTVTGWQQVRNGFPDKPLVLYGPGTVSGTYDYFTEAIVGGEGHSRADFWASEDDDMLVEGIAHDPSALGFFGLSYYDRNRDKLKLISIDDGKGCVEPNTETVSSGLYQPLSRPLFIYVNKARVAENQNLNQFIEFYLDNAASLVDDVGYIPLTDSIYELARQRFAEQKAGSVFEGVGASVGVSLADLLVKEQ